MCSHWAHLTFNHFCNGFSFSVRAEPKVSSSILRFVIFASFYRSNKTGTLEWAILFIEQFMEVLQTEIHDEAISTQIVGRDFCGNLDKKPMDVFSEQWGVNCLSNNAQSHPPIVLRWSTYWRLLFMRLLLQNRYELMRLLMDYDKGIPPPNSKSDPKQTFLKR